MDWIHRHLLGIAQLSRDDILHVLEGAERWFETARDDVKNTARVARVNATVYSSSIRFASPCRRTVGHPPGMPRQYCEYLELTAERPAFQKYPSAERLRDFQKIFGRDLKLVESQVLRFMDELR